MKKPFMHALPRIKSVWLIAALLLVTAGMGASAALSKLEQHPWYAIGVRASQRAAYAQQHIKQYLEASGIPLEQEDLNATGLIGPAWTPLTTSMGQLEAKRTSLNADFAGLMVKYFHQAGLRPGDYVAIGASGSFPALSIAALCAAQEMGLKARVIASLGASMYGATRPELPISAMLRMLQDAGILRHDLLALSLGGDEDQGLGGMFPEGPDVLLALAQQESAALILPASLTGSIQQRLALYGQDIRCFVNIGGASVNLGEVSESLRLPPGLITSWPHIPQDPRRGLMFEYLSQGVPVVHLLNIKRLAADEGLPFDPLPLPSPGHAAFYFRTSTPIALPVLSLLLALLCLIYGHISWRRDIRRENRRENNKTI